MDESVNLEMAIFRFLPKAAKAFCSLYFHRRNRYIYLLFIPPYIEIKDKLKNKIFGALIISMYMLVERKY